MSTLCPLYVHFMSTLCPLYVYRSVMNSLLYPLVFIASESHHGMSSPSKLFTKTVLSDLDIHTISFNPIAHTSLIKTLQKITAIECCNKAPSSKGRGAPRGAVEGKFHMPPREVIECLAESSAGDVRSAINALQFACLKGNTNILSLLHEPIDLFIILSMYHGNRLYRSAQTQWSYW